MKAIRPKNSSELLEAVAKLFEDYQKDYPERISTGLSAWFPQQKKK